MRPNKRKKKKKKKNEGVIQNKTHQDQSFYMHINSFKGCFSDQI